MIRLSVKTLLCFIFLLFVEFVNAQTIVQPKIMVIPYTKEGEDMRALKKMPSDKMAEI